MSDLKKVVESVWESLRLLADEANTITVDRVDLVRILEALEIPSDSMTQEADSLEQEIRLLRAQMDVTVSRDLGTKTCTVSWAGLDGVLTWAANEACRTRFRAGANT